MQKKCKKCGKLFVPKQPHFEICPDCYSKRRERDILSSSELLSNYYDSKGEFLKEVFIGLPERLANIFANDKLNVKQLRDFHRKISKARNKALLRGIDTAKSLLYQCYRDIDYQLKRRVIPKSFAHFMKHHLSLAEKDEKSLEGFYQHFDSIVCYFPLKK